MKPRQIARLTLFAALAPLLGACMATPITLPMNDTWQTHNDGAMMADAGSADLSMDAVGGHPDALKLTPDSGNAGPDGGITEGGPGEGGITEGGPGEGGITEGGPGEGGVTDLASGD